jgi:hypothetical protein
LLCNCLFVFFSSAIRWELDASQSTFSMRDIYAFRVWFCSGCRVRKHSLFSSRKGPS